MAEIRGVLKKQGGVKRKSGQIPVKAGANWKKPVGLKSHRLFWPVTFRYLGKPLLGGGGGCGMLRCDINGPACPSCITLPSHQSQDNSVVPSKCLICSGVSSVNISYCKPPAVGRAETAPVQGSHMALFGRHFTVFGAISLFLALCHRLRRQIINFF